MTTDEITRNLVLLAYQRGWADACNDHLAQRRDSKWAIGESKRADANEVLRLLDPNNVLGLL